MIISTKRQFVREYQKGTFGNASPTWNTFEDFERHLVSPQYVNPQEKFYHLRNRIAGGPTYYNLPGNQAYTLWRNAEYRNNWYVSEMAPTHLTLFQGEVRRTTRHLDLYYSRYVAPMRESLLKGGRQQYGILALSLLKYYLDSSSYEWLNYLLDEFDGHVVEFSTYATQWGTVPGMNTIFWEVRLY